MLAVFITAARSSFRESAGRAIGSGRAALAGTIVVALLTLSYIGTLVVAMTWQGSRTTSYPPQFTVTFGPDGRSWLTRQRYDWKTYQQEVDRVAKMTPAKSVKNRLEPVPAGWQALKSWNLREISPVERGRLGRPFVLIAQTQASGVDYPARRTWVFDLRKRDVAVYRQGRTITLERRLQPEPSGPDRFHDVFVQPGYWPHADDRGFVLATSQALYFVPVDGSSVALMYDTPDSSELTSFQLLNGESTERPPKIEAVARFGDRAVILESHIADEDRVFAERQEPSPPLMELFATEVRLPTELLDSISLQLARSPTAAGEFVGLAEQVDGNFVWCRFDQNGQLADLEKFVESTAPESAPAQVFVAALVPPGLAGLGITITLATVDDKTASVAGLIKAARDDPEAAFTTAALIFCCGFAGLVLANWAAGRRQLTRSWVRRWWLVGFLLGPAGGLSLLAVYPRVVRIPCPACRAATRRDRGDCEVCGKPIDEVVRSGVEVFDDEGLRTEAALGLAKSV